MKTDDKPESEITLVGLLASLASVLSFLTYLRRGDLLLYGDAVAHTNIARRVFDSLTPGPLQLGTVWLPLPHLLMMPFLVSDWMWRNGAGGAIPSLVAYVFATVGVFRLVRGIWGRMPAWLAAGVFGLNPNLLYLQSTAMTEPLAICLFVWAVVYLNEFARGENGGAASHRALLKSGWFIAAAELTRYDGWFLAFAAGLLVAAFAVRRWRDRQLRLAVIKFLLLLAAAPALWLAYNAAAYRNPLEFANGPYSAKAIDQRNTSATFPAHPGAGNVRVAGQYFLKAAEANMGEGRWQKLWIVFLVGGMILVGFRFLTRRCFDPVLAVALLLTPIPFYMLTMAYAGVPLYVPGWWPFGLYNIRYGLQLLPAFAVLTAVLAASLAELVRVQWLKASVAGLIAMLVAGSYASAWKAQPIGYREAWVNSRARLAQEKEMARQVRLWPRDSIILMDLSYHSWVMQDAGVPFRRVINEVNHRPWMKAVDPEGPWDLALADPAKYADFVVACDGDQVAKAVNRRDLTLLSVIETQGQPTARLYAVKKHGN